MNIYKIGLWFGYVLLFVLFVILLDTVYQVYVAGSEEFRDKMAIAALSPFLIWHFMRFCRERGEGR